MTTYCILGCSPKERSKHIHRFPSPRFPIIYYAWLDVIPSKFDKKNFDYRKYRVCDRHFEPEAKYSIGLAKNRLIRSAIPTLHLPNPVAHDGCDSPREFIGHKIDGEVKELIKYEHSYAAPRSSNGELQKEDTIVDDTTLNTYENGVDTTKVDLTKLIDSYNIEETCYSDAEQLLSHLDVAEVTEIASIADNKENIASQDQNEIRELLQKSENISNCNLSSCDDLLSNKEECQNINTKKNVNTATTKYPENIIITGQMQHVLDDASVNKVNISSAGFKRKRNLIESYNIKKTCYSDSEPLLSHLDVAEVTEIANIADNKENIATQDQNEIRELLQKSENISNCNLSSCDDILLSNKKECQNINTKKIVNTATTKYPENIITGQMQHVLDGANVNKVNISSTSFRKERNLIESHNIEETCYSCYAEQILSHLDVAEVAEIASTGKNKEYIASQDQKEIRETLQKSEDIGDCNLSSCDDLPSDKEVCQNINTKNTVSTAITKYIENIKTGQIHHILDDANANKVNKSGAGFRRNSKYLYYPIQPKSGRSAIISKQEISKISTLRKNRSIKAYICFDKYNNNVSKESQANLNQMKPLLINSMSSFNTQSNSPYKQSVSFDFALFKYRDKVLNASLLLNLENKDHNSLKFGGYNANDFHQLEGKHSLHQSGCNTHVNSIGEESVREICDQANPESRSIPNDELCLSDKNTQNNTIIQDAVSTNPDRHIMSESKSIPNDELCLSDIHTLDNGIHRLFCTSPDRHVSVRICEENCVNPDGPVSPKPEKLHVSELDIHVGSTTYVYGGFEPNDDEPVEDPLAIHSPDLGIKDSGALNEDSMTCFVENNINVVEDHNVSNVEDNMSSVKDNISNFEGNISDAEDNMSIIEINMSNKEDNISNVEDNISDVEDNIMSVIKDNMSNIEDNISNVEGNISDVEDNMSIIEINMSNKEDNISNVEGNISDAEDNMSIIEINMSNKEDNISNVEDNISDVEDNIMSVIKDNMSNIEDNISNVEGNISDVEDNMSIIEINMSNVEDTLSNAEGNLSDIEDNMSVIEINMSNIENNISNVEGNLSDVEDNMSIIEINRSNIEDNISNVEGNLSVVEDSTSFEENMSTEKDNMSYKKDNRHLVDRFDSKHCIDDFVHREECNDDLDLRLEIAFALKFMYNKDKTPKEAVEEIIETYGKGKLTLKEAICWYHEFKLGNNIMRIISSGGPVYK